MFFRDIIGHEDIKAHLIQSVSEGKIPHARLLCGPDGVGKLGMAIAYARYLNCTGKKPGDTDSCGECPSCRQITSMMHPDIHYVFPIYKTSKPKRAVSDDYIKEWRHLLSETTYISLESWLSEINAENAQPQIYVDESQDIIRKLTYKSFQSEYKVMIIWLPELMNEGCANKLLKILEEPYDKTIFLLVSNRPDKLLATILSRTQPLNFKSLPAETISQAIQTNFNVDKEAADGITRLAGGSYRRALDLMRQTGENSQFFDLFVQMMRLSYARKIKEMKAWSEEVAKLGREAEKRFLQYCQRMLRENYIYNAHIPSIVYLTPEERNFSTRFAPFINEKNVIEIMEEFGRAENDISRNANAKIVFFDLSIKMILLIKRAT
ncbi:MAG: DNA polymerase III subunit delta' [Bacteroidales bacterium]|nr:DNA polymerase III subunit delta' [Bacteroidales bacterium]